MNCNDLSEGSTEGKLQHHHFKVMFKLCLYGDILIVSGGGNTKWSVVPVWRLGIRTHLEWAWVLKYYYMLALACTCSLCCNNYMEVTSSCELNIRIWSWKCKQLGHPYWFYFTVRYLCYSLLLSPWHDISSGYGWKWIIADWNRGFLSWKHSKK
jgi:hypothetical protein